MSISSKAQATIIKRKVKPVIILASDQKLTKVITARYQKTLTYIEDWYHHWISKGRTTKSLSFSNILSVNSNLKSKHWVYLSDISEMGPTRFDLFYEAQKQLVKNNYNKPGEIYLGMIYAGEFTENKLGAASAGGCAIIPPQSKQECVKFSSNNSPQIPSLVADCVYAAAHELGHCFGLGHTCDDYKNDSQCWNSFMQQGRPPNMTMLTQEIDRLRAKSEWFY
jgi:hypothetical protein